MNEALQLFTIACDRHLSRDVRKPRVNWEPSDPSEFPYLDAVKISASRIPARSICYSEIEIEIEIRIEQTDSPSYSHWDLEKMLVIFPPVMIKISHFLFRESRLNDYTDANFLCIFRFTFLELYSELYKFYNVYIYSHL